MSEGIDRKGARRPTGYGARDKLLQSFPPIEQVGSLDRVRRRRLAARRCRAST